MPVITQKIGLGERRDEVTAIQQALIGMGAKIKDEELATANLPGIYNRSTQDAVNNLFFRMGVVITEFDEVPGVFDASAGRLLHVAVAAESGNSAVSRNALREAFDEIHTEPAANEFELACFARHAVMAQAFDLALQFIELMPNGFPLVESIVKNNALQSPEPDLQNPENFYTFRYQNASTNFVRLVIDMALN